jgi:cell division protein FtsB
MLRPTRLLALACLALVGVLYWNPLRSYERTSATLRAREQQVEALSDEARQLQARIASVRSGQGLVQEARRLGFVKPGERLFIVRGISAWRAAH